MAEKWRVTAFESVAVTKTYTAASRQEAVEKMTRWTKQQEENHGCIFLGTMRVEKVEDNG